MVEKQEENSLALLPVMDIKGAQEAFKTFEKIKNEVLDAAKDISLIKGKSYVNKAGWRKIKTVFGISEEILSSRKEIDEDKTIRWIYRVRVIHKPTGISADAEASCDTKEEFSYLNKEKGTKKPENMIMAMAQTRGFNRAISDLVGGGDLLSAEDEQVIVEEVKDNTPPLSVCSKCNAEITGRVKEFSIKKYKRILCIECQKIADAEG